MTETKQKPSLASQLFLPYEMLEQISKEDIIGNGAVFYVAGDNASSILKSSVLGNSKDLHAILAQTFSESPEVAEVVCLALINAVPETSTIGKLTRMIIKHLNTEQDDEE